MARKHKHHQPDQARATAAPPRATTATAPTALITALTTAQRDSYNQIITAAMDNATDAEREKIDRRLKRICDKSGESVAGSRALASIVSPAAAAALIAYSGGVHVRIAMASAGLDMSHDWGVITQACNDPRFAAAWMAARAAAGQRIADKAVGVVEQSMDGVEVDGRRARLATWALERMGGYADPARTWHAPESRTPATAAAQVVINLGGDKDLNICSNLLQGSRGGVING